MTDDRPNDPQGASPAGSTPPGSPEPGSSPYDQTSPWSSPPSSPPPSAPSYGAAPSYEQAPPPVPYGQQQPYAQQPYGQPYGQQGGYPGAPQPAGYGGGYAPAPVAQARSSATLWLILNIVSVFLCSNLPGIVGAIYAGLAMSKVHADLADAQKKTRLAKIWFFAGLVLAAIVIIGGIIALVVFADGASSDFSEPADI